jgi:GT2 family glycosyltransferase
VRWVAGRGRLVLTATEAATHAGIELWAPRSLRAPRVTGRLTLRDPWVAHLEDVGASLDVAFRLEPGSWNRLEFPLPRQLAAGTDLEVTLEIERPAPRWTKRARPDSYPRSAAVHRIWLRGDRITAAQVTIVVLNWKRAAETIACLESLQRAELGGATVLVVDNGSHDGSVETIRARFPDQPIVVVPENRGYAGGNNAGIRAALDRGAAAVLLLNNDTEVAPDFLPPLVWAFNSDIDVAAVSGAILRMDHPQTLDVAWLDVYWGHGIVRRQGVNALPGEGFTDRRAIDAGIGCCLLLGADALRRIGMLDERYFAYHEEVDWCVRAGAAGRRILYQPLSRVWHGGSKSTGALRDPLAAGRTIDKTEALPNAAPLSWNPVRSYLGARNSVRFIRNRASRTRQLYFLASTLYSLPLELLAVLLRREEELMLGLWTYRRALALYCGGAADQGGAALVRALRIATRLPVVLVWRIPRDLRAAAREGRLAQLAETWQGLWDGLRDRPLPLQRLGLR